MRLFGKRQPDAGSGSGHSNRIYQLVLGKQGDAIGDHWFGDYDGHPMPRLASGDPLLNVISLRMDAIPGFDRNEFPSRLYFPWHFGSDYGIADANYIRHTNDGMELLTSGDVKVLWHDAPLAPRPVTLRPLAEPLSEQDLEALWPRWITGSHPVVTSEPGIHWWISCMRCGELTRFVLQLQSGGPETFCVYDGETLYYGWCSRCRILAVEAHTW